MVEVLLNSFLVDLVENSGVLTVHDDSIGLVQVLGGELLHQCLLHAVLHILTSLLRIAQAHLLLRTFGPRVVQDVGVLD